GQPGGVVGAADPGLGHRHHVGRDGRHQPFGPFAVDGERGQVPLVHPDQGGPDGQRPVQLGLVVDLDQGIEADVGGQPGQFSQLRVAEGGDDQQDGVGPHQAGVEDVGRADGEVLAEHRHPGGGPGGHQVVGGPAEVVPVGQYRQAGGPAGDVGGGHLGRVEVGGQVAIGRRPALHFGDHRQAAAAGAVAGGGRGDGGGEPLGRRAVEGGPPEGVDVPPVGGGGRPVCGHDLRQVGGHGRPSVAGPRRPPAV